MLKQIKQSNYYISEDGKVFNQKTNKYLKGSLDKDGYLRFKLEGKNVSIHRMVLETFKPIEDMSYFEVNHINGIKTDNRLENLEWVTHQENMKHMVKTNLSQKCSNKGSINGRAKLTEQQVKNIRQDTRNYQKIANDYGVTKSTISAIKNYKLWSHVK